jgi:hypothetical protein
MSLAPESCGRRFIPCDAVGPTQVVSVRSSGNLPLGPLPLRGDKALAKAARANWARFIKKVFAATPLVCRATVRIAAPPAAGGSSPGWLTGEF